MKFADYRKYDAIGLAALVVKRQVRAKEVLETAIARAEQVNPSINAIIHKQYGQARTAVTHGLPQGPLSRDNLDENGGGDQSLKRRPVALE